MTARISRFLYPHALFKFKSLINLAWDYVWLHICVKHVQWFIKFHNVRGLGELLRRLTMLSGSTDTNANLCLFLRFLYTYCPPAMAFDQRERIFGCLFLEKQYLIAAWIIRTFGMRFLPPLLRPFYMSYYGRANRASEFVHRCIDNGTEQLIILGAGYDSTAYRLRDKRILRNAKGVSRYVEVYEVDRPCLQDRKLEFMKAGLSEAEWLYFTEGVHFVGCEFGVDSIGRKLLDAGFNPARSSAILWEGVTYYLTAEALAQTLTELQDLYSMKTVELTAKTSLAETPTSERRLDSQLHSPCDYTRASAKDETVEMPRPIMFMDYMRTVHTTIDEKHKDDWIWDLAREQAAASGTSFRTGFTDVKSELDRYGLKIINHLESTEELHQIFQKDETGYHQIFREHNATLGHNQPRLSLVECEFVST